MQEWPERALRITAVDARTGAFRVFDRDSGVPLVHAVAASCAVPGVWPPVTIGDRPRHRAVDGVEPQVAGLRAAGSRVALVTPDAAAVAAIRPDVLDPARRAVAARTARAQAASVVTEIRGVWTGRSG